MATITPKLKELQEFAQAMGYSLKKQGLKYQLWKGHGLMASLPSQKAVRSYLEREKDLVAPEIEEENQEKEEQPVFTPVDETTGVLPEEEVEEEVQTEPEPEGFDVKDIPLDRLSHYDVEPKIDFPTFGCTFSEAAQLLNLPEDTPAQEVLRALASNQVRVQVVGDRLLPFTVIT